MQKYIDIHSHSLHSMDGKDSVPELCRRAEALKIAAYAITDHCEMNNFQADNCRVHILKSLEEMERLRRERHWNTELLTGVEIGQALEFRGETERFLDEIWDKTDFVIGSLHAMYRYTDFYFLDYRNENIPELLKRYFVELLDLVRWGRFDSLAHITYPIRYMKEQGYEPDLEAEREAIERVLRAQAERGGAIEVNTSGLRGTLKETLPPFWMVKRFRELGGEYVTIGSDSHCVEDVGKGIADAANLLKEAGFTHMTYYKKHKPIQIPIE